ncbi:MAG: methyltransferase domain-containing protein [Candidatus Dadabacteria bacterium]|nr:methyltransferase domain-containing protein [Candidatus Dadabacteria bacterium]
MEFSDIAEMSSAFWGSRILHVAVKLGVFDTLEEESMTVDEAARALGTEGRATWLFFNALVALKLLHKEGQSYSNTDAASKYLVKTSPRYFGHMVLFEESLWELWGRLENSLKTGEPSRKPDMFQDLEENTERFIMAMHSLVSARGDDAVLASMLGLGGVKTVLDVGSGPGTYPITFLNKFPHLEITIFDLPGTLAVTRRVLSGQGMEGRIKLLEGDYITDDLPGGFDLIMLSNIIHGESEEVNRSLMGKIYKSLNPGGRLVIKDHILNDDMTSPAVGAIFSIQMLLSAKGRDYSFTEVKEWLHCCSFKNIEWVRLEHPINSSLVIGER